MMVTYRLSRYLLRASVCLTVLAFVCPVSADERQLIPVDGDAYRASFEAFTADNGLSFSSDGVEKRLTSDDIVVWGAYREPGDATLVMLVDGSLLVAELLYVDDDSLTITSELFGTQELPRTLVRGIIFELPAAVEERDSLVLSFGDESPSSDKLLMANGDQLSGTLQPAKGEVELFGIDTLEFQLTGKARSLSIAIDRIAAVYFSETRTRQATDRSTAYHVGLADGSLLAVSTASPKDDHLEFRLACGALLRGEAASVTTQLCYLRPTNGRVTYLSDLPSPNYKSLPLLRWKWPLGVDRNVLLGRLRHKKAIVRKGLGMHSASRVAYTLDKPFRRFQAELALDDLAGQGGSVIYRVFLESTADGKPTWQAAYASPVIRADDLIPISVDVSAASRIALLVEFADRGSEHDHANWLNARLVE